MQAEARQPRPGDVQVAPWSEYEPGQPGFVIEQFGYWNREEPCWAIPAWEERGGADLDGVFPTREAAERALREA